MLIYRGIVLVWYNAVIICKEDFPLDENKDKTLSGGNDESYGSTFDRNTEDVKKEMEELAVTFQRELDKTKAEAEEKASLYRSLRISPRLRPEMMTRSLRKPSFANAAVRKGAAQKPTPIRRIVKNVISVFVTIRSAS